jgi:hypothetical protein
MSVDRGRPEVSAIRAKRREQPLQKLFRDAKLDRYRGMADIEQASPYSI